MNFSESFKHSGYLCQFSNDTKYVACASQHRLVIRNVKSLQIEHLFTCLDVIQEIEWSPDSLFVLCGLFKRSLVQVFSLEEPQWTCKIDEGSAGIIGVRWAPDSRHILSTAEFNLRVTVWSLATKSVSYIKYPKGFMDFSSDGLYLALAERRDCKDFVSIFDCNAWQLCKHFAVDTRDSSGLAWSPDCSMLAVWDSCISYKILLYSPDGRCLASYSAYDNALGIKTVSWSPSSQFCAVGSYDQLVRVLNHLTWKPFMEFEHPATLVADIDTTVVYREVLLNGPSAPGDVSPSMQRIHREQTRYEVHDGPASLLQVKPDADKPNPRLGVGLCAFSSDSVYLATRSDSLPNTVWIWDIPRLCLVSVLVQASAVKCFEWSPASNQLAICTATSQVYIWSPQGCVSTNIPLDVPFLVQKLRWSPCGSSLAVMTKERFCVCFLPSEELVTSNGGVS